MSYVSCIESLEIHHHICDFTKYVLTLKTEACVLVTKIREQCLGFCLKWWYEEKFQRLDWGFKVVGKCREVIIKNKASAQNVLEIDKQMDTEKNKCYKNTHREEEGGEGGGQEDRIGEWTDLRERKDSLLESSVKKEPSRQEKLPAHAE